MTIEGKTASGFAFAVDEQLIQDFHFLEVLADFNSPDTLTRMRAIVLLPELLLGSEGKAALLEHVRDEHGYSPSKRVVEEINNIISLCGERSRAVKNS